MMATFIRVWEWTEVRTRATIYHQVIFLLWKRYFALRARPQKPERNETGCSGPRQSRIRTSWVPSTFKRFFKISVLDSGKLKRNGRRKIIKVDSKFLERAWSEANGDRMTSILIGINLFKDNIFQSWQSPLLREGGRGGGRKSDLFHSELQALNSLIMINFKMKCMPI